MVQAIIDLNLNTNLQLEVDMLFFFKIKHFLSFIFEGFCLLRLKRPAKVVEGQDGHADFSILFYRWQCGTDAL